MSAPAPKRFISSTSVRRSGDPTEIKPHTLQSFLDWPHIWDIITHIKDRENSGEVLWECDYSFVTSALLPYYFRHTQNTTWVITPEYNHLEANHPDYTIFTITRNPFNKEIFAVVELKSKTGKSWNANLEQMWKQCDAVRNPQGKLWAIGQKGFEICFFRFDLLKFEDQIPDVYTNFDPLNLANLNTIQLDSLDVKYVECDNNGSSRISLIKWRLDNLAHVPYIHNMFLYIKSHKP